MANQKRVNKRAYYSQSPYKDVGLNSSTARGNRPQKRKSYNAFEGVTLAYKKLTKKFSKNKKVDRSASRISLRDIGESWRHY